MKKWWYKIIYSIITSWKATIVWVETCWKEMQWNMNNSWIWIVGLSRFLARVGGLPWFSGKESAWQCRRHRFDPWSEKISHVMGKQSPCTTTTECALESRSCNCWSLGALEPVLCHNSSHCNETPLHHKQGVAPYPLLQLQKAWAAKRPSTPLNKKYIHFLKVLLTFYISIKYYIYNCCYCSFP